MRSKEGRAGFSSGSISFGYSLAASFARAVISFGTYRSICTTWSATSKYAPELPATMTVDIPNISYRSLTRSIKGVIGSISRWMTLCISSSRTMKLVALVSSSIKNVLAPASRPSTTLAACEVLPLASSVSKEAVFLPFGRSLMNMEISVRLMLLPSSARILSAVSSVTTYSLPSPAICGYTPVSRAFKSVDFP